MNTETAQGKLPRKWYKKKRSWAIMAVLIIVVAAFISGRGMPNFKGVPDSVNDSSLALKGWGVEPGARVRIYLNSEPAGEVQADGDGNFDAELELREGKNTFYAVADYKGKPKKGAEESVEYEVKNDDPAVQASDEGSDSQEAQPDQSQDNAASEESQPQDDSIGQEDGSNDMATDDQPSQASAAGEDGSHDESSITRSEIIGLFPEFGIHSAMAIDGRENYVGKAKENAILQVIGSEDDMDEIAYSTVMDANSVDLMKKQDEYFDRLLDALIPGTKGYELTELFNDGDKMSKGGYEIIYSYVSLGSGTYSQTYTFVKEK